MRFLDSAPEVHAKGIVLCTLLLVGMATEFDAGLATSHARVQAEVPLFPDLGTHHREVRTKVPLAQRYFDQGLILTYAFNHPEAARAFEEAGRLDPDCAMAHWGLAFVLGPNINAPMEADVAQRIAETLEKGRRAAQGDLEEALFAALEKRYEPDVERADADRAFANAMLDIHAEYPEDLDIATLAAEALMNTSPWNYWLPDGTPKPDTERLLAILEMVLAKDPNHPGANHYHIHAVEASPNPERGLPSAKRLETLVPGAGHLIHMPSHIYLRMGMYHAASQSNEAALVIDDAYIRRYAVAGSYPANYFSHNAHFLAFSSMKEGRWQRSIWAAERARGIIDAKEAAAMGHLQWMRAAPMYVAARFARWDILAEQPEPPSSLPFERAVWHFTHGLAASRRGDADRVETELDRLRAIAEDPMNAMLEMPMFPGLSLLEQHLLVLDAELTGLRGDRAGRILRLQQAVTLEDCLPYMEPPYAYLPVRPLLGSAYLQQGDVQAAGRVFAEDLERLPHNGWSLFGQLLCERLAGRATDAVTTEQRFRNAFIRADITLTTPGY